MDAGKTSGGGVLRRWGTTLGAGSLALLLSVACSKKPDEAGTTVDIRPKPADTTVTDPTTLRITLRVTGDSVEIVAAEPKRGNASHHDEAREIAEAVSGHLRMMSFRVLDANGVVLSSGRFTVPGVAIAEYQDPDSRERIIREEDEISSTAVAVSIPYNAAMRAVEIAELTPATNLPPDQWSAKPATQVQIPAGVVP